MTALLKAIGIDPVSILVRILAGVAALAIVGYVLHWASENGARKERLAWMTEKSRIEREAQQKVDAAQVEAAARAEQGELRAAELQRRIREVEDAARGSTTVCIDRDAAERLRNLRRR